MQQQALYVVSDLGRDMFIWAVSATEAREQAAAARMAEPACGSYEQTLVPGTAQPRLPERHMRFDAVAER